MQCRLVPPQEPAFGLLSGRVHHSRSALSGGKRNWAGARSGDCAGARRVCPPGAGFACCSCRARRTSCFPHMTPISFTQPLEHPWARGGGPCRSGATGVAACERRGRRAGPRVPARRSESAVAPCTADGPFGPRVSPSSWGRHVESGALGEVAARAASALGRERVGDRSLPSPTENDTSFGLHRRLGEVSLSLRRRGRGKWVHG